MRLPFSKWQATGNDFVLLDLEAAQRATRWCLDRGSGMAEVARLVCDRHFGVGSDGLLAMMAPERDDAFDLRMDFWNPDGSEAGMCGNGARCFASAGWARGAPDPLRFQVGAGAYRASREMGTGRVWVAFPGAVDVTAVEDSTGRLWVCHPGTEHIVWPVEGSGPVGHDPDVRERWKQQARELRREGRVLPRGGNVNMVWALNDGALGVLTFERGVEDFTLSCGTGAVAAALAMHVEQGEPEGGNTREIRTPGGPLAVRFRHREGCSGWDGEGVARFEGIELGGPAVKVFDGELDLDALSAMRAVAAPDAGPVGEPIGASPTPGEPKPAHQPPSSRLRADVR